MTPEAAQIVAAGGGYAGLWVCRGLARPGFDVRLIDLDNCLGAAASSVRPTPSSHRCESQLYS